MLATACLSANVNDFAFVAMLGLLGLRIGEAWGASIEDLGEEHYTVLGGLFERVCCRAGSLARGPSPLR